MKEIIINVDAYNENSIRTVEGDNLSEVYKIYICKNKRRIDLTNKIAVMAYVNEYGSKKSNILALNITNAAEGEIELPITNVISNENGVYACQIAIYGENNSLEQTAPFSLIVENNIFSKISNTAINSTDFHILSEAIKTTNAYCEKLKEGTENIELQYANKLNEKLDKDGIVTMANMGQDVKEAMTGGSVAVVGRNSVLKENIVDGQVSIEKLDPILSDTINKDSWEILSPHLTDWSIDYSDKKLIINGITRLYVKTNNDEGFPKRIAHTGSLEIPSQSCAYVNLTLDKDLYNIQVTDNMYSLPVKSIILFSNYYGIIGGAMAGHLITKDYKKDIDNLSKKLELDTKTNITWFKMDTKPVHWNEESKTLTWEGDLVAVLGYAPPYFKNRIKVASGSHTFKDTAYSVMYLDITDVSSDDLNEPTCIKSGNYFTEDGYTPSPTSIPIAKYNANDGGFKLINFVDLDTVNTDNVPEELSLDTNVYLKVTKDKLEIYRQCFNKEYYTCQTFAHFVSSDSDCDIWKLAEVYICKKNELDFTLAFEQPLVINGEWECAIKEEGQPDFIGGLIHGDEHMEEIKVIVDGSPIDLSNYKTYICNNITIIETSSLYRCNSKKNEKVATHGKKYSIDFKKLIVGQVINWEKSLSLESSYLCMLPVARQYIGTETYITSEGATDFDYKVLDLIKNHSNIDRKKGVKYAEIWNKEKGYQFYARVKTLESNNLEENAFFFANAPQYNKFYFDYCGNNYNTQIGEVWKNESEYVYNFKGFIQ